MAIRLRPEAWSDVLRDFIEVPLDDADARTIQVARRLAKGESLTVDQVQQLLSYPFPPGQGQRR